MFLLIILYKIVIYAFDFLLHALRYENDNLSCPFRRQKKNHFYCKILYFMVKSYYNTNLILFKQPIVFLNNRCYI